MPTEKELKDIRQLKDILIKIEEEGTTLPPVEKILTQKGLVKRKDNKLVLTFMGKISLKALKSQF